MGNGACVTTARPEIVLRVATSRYQTVERRLIRAQAGAISPSDEDTQVHWSDNDLKYEWACVLSTHATRGQEERRSRCKVYDGRWKWSVATRKRASRSFLLAIRSHRAPTAAVSTMSCWHATPTVPLFRIATATRKPHPQPLQLVTHHPSSHSQAGPDSSDAKKKCLWPKSSERQG